MMAEWSMGVESAVSNSVLQVMGIPMVPLERSHCSINSRPETAFKAPILLLVAHIQRGIVGVLRHGLSYTMSPEFFNCCLFTVDITQEIS